MDEYLTSGSVSVRRNFFAISCVVVAEPLSSTVLLPFVYFMVQDFGYVEGEIGTRAGMITSAFFIAQMFSNPLWSILSNRIGRKPCLVLGLLGTAVSMIFFSLAPSLSWAIVFRSLCGVMNGNNPIARTVVGELSEVTGVGKAQAFSLFGFCLAGGWMVGPLIGGLLADPMRHWGFPGPLGVFEYHKWLFPCAFVASYNTIVAILACLFLDETSKFSLRVRKTCAQTSAASTFSQETTPVAPGSKRNSWNCSVQETSSLASGSKRNSQNYSVEETTPLIPGSNRNSQIYSVQDSSETVTPKVNFRKVQGLATLSAIFYFIHIIFFDELFPLFAASDISSGNGLSFLPQDIAKALVFAGPAMLSALVFFTMLHGKFGSRTLFRATAIIFAMIYPLFSLLPSIRASTGPIALWISLVFLIIIRYSGMVVGLASIQILFNDAARPSERAFLNGLAQSAGSFARAVGPTLGGSTWSWSLRNGLSAPLDYHAAFLLLSILGIGQYLSTLGIPTDEVLEEERIRTIMVQDGQDGEGEENV
ncbi:major facilitator superfamily domain-containing protein [Hypoxylon sp. FL0890]|nr:major facilitator superfamily domain-containing protein [Hypoxylon sp. FL0890]